MKTRTVVLATRPTGIPVPSNFELVENELQKPEGDQVLVRNQYISVDPYMRGRMQAGKSYTAPFEPGQAMSGGAVGEVEESGCAGFKPGDIVLSNYGWRDRFVANPAELKKIVPDGIPPQSFLGIMGMPGKTAYYGLLKIGKPKAGETVFVSGGAGAVGSAVCQIAKIKNCHVVASTGTQEKAKWLIDEAGVDEVIQYSETTNLGRTVRKKCPNGIDIYYDNVGGDHLQAALSCMNDFGRVVSCGMISRYNDTRPAPGPNNLSLIVGRRLKLQGFIISDHPEIDVPCENDYREWIKAGRLTWKETVVEGIENAAGAFIGLFSGENFGKMLVKVS